MSALKRYTIHDSGRPSMLSGEAAVENNVEGILVIIRYQCFSLAFAGVPKGPDFFKEIHFFLGPAIVSHRSR